MKNLSTTIDVEGISCELSYKKIKNMYLKIQQPKGTVIISAPLSMDMASIRKFVLAKTPWIKKHQKNIRVKQREKPAGQHTQKGHYYLGKCYKLHIVEHNAPALIVVNDDAIAMYVKKKTGVKKRRELFEEWLRDTLKQIIPEIICRYDTLMGVTVGEFCIKKMKTRWGTCNRTKKRIWLNLELAKRPREHIEYVVVHEMTHLLEPRHNKHFYDLMSRFLPDWRRYKEEMNLTPPSW